MTNPRSCQDDTILVASEISWMEELDKNNETAWTTREQHQQQREHQPKLTHLLTPITIYGLAKRTAG